VRAKPWTSDGSGWVRPWMNRGLSEEVGGTLKDLSSMKRFTFQYFLTIHVQCSLEMSVMSTLDLTKTLSNLRITGKTLRCFTNLLLLL
jgi:hypothetical protein